MKRFSQKYENSITMEKILTAWQEFLPGKKNRKDVAAFQVRLMDNLASIQNDLVQKTYAHGGYQAFNISDPKPRNIHKATVRDRLLHHVLYNELYYYFDSKFIYDSYSCRVNKGTHRALYRFKEMAGKVSKNDTRTCWILKCDIRKFFASIDHSILKKILERHIEDKDMLGLLGRVIDSFHTEGQNGIGLPLGNLTSQLLVNIYMNEFDHYMKRKLKAIHYIRYADDFVVLSDSKPELELLLPKIHEFLEDFLRLKLHPDKVFIKTLASGVDFLGWVHFPNHRVLRTATKKRTMRGLRNNQKPESIASYRGMLKHGNTHKLKTRLGIL